MSNQPDPSNPADAFGDRTPYKLFGNECGPGWWPLIEPLVLEVQRVGGHITQIKEKFGTLRFYFVAPEAEYDRIDDLVHEAEYASSMTCEECGAEATTHHQGWWKTLCVKHAEEHSPEAKEEVERRIRLRRKYLEPFWRQDHGE